MDMRPVGAQPVGAAPSSVASSASSTRPAALPLPELPPRDVVNWNGRIAVRGMTVYKPTREDEIIAIVKKERAVRVGGGLHSFNAAMVPARGGAFIDLSAFNRISFPVKHIDGTYSVRVQPGATVKQVSTALAAQGLALESLPTSEDITIGGATANGAHGSGINTPAVLAEQIVGMTVVTSDGEKKVVALEDLPLYRISMGLLGIATEIELRCVPDFDLVTDDDKLVGEDAVIAALDSSRLRADLGKHDNVTYLINPDHAHPENTQLIRRRLKKLTKEESAQLEASGVARKGDYDKPSWTQQQLINGAYKAAAAASGTLAQTIKAKIRNQSQPRTPLLGRSALMYQQWLDVPAHDVSYALPLDKSQEAYKRVIAKMRELGYETPVPLSLRFLRGTDRTLMGMNSGRDVVTFELLTHVAFDDANGEKRAEVKAADEAFEQIMIEMGGRPHWGKEYTKSPEASFTPAVWKRFAQEREKVGAKLTNAWAEQFAPTIKR